MIFITPIPPTTSEITAIAEISKVPLTAAEPTYIDDMMEEAVRDGIPALAEKIQNKLASSL